MAQSVLGVLFENVGEVSWQLHPQPAPAAVCVLLPTVSSQRRGRMAVSHSLKERTISENSLIILLQGLQGQVTTVDLRDESVAHGRIENVDAFMNIRLAKVTYTDRWGHQVKLDDLFVTGRNVRYVHIPDDVNITATIEQQLQIIHRVRNFGSKGQGRREFPSKKYK